MAKIVHVNFRKQLDRMTVDDLMKRLEEMALEGEQFDEMLRDQGDFQKSREISLSMARRAEFLWYPYLPLHRLTTLQALPGVGKTMVVCKIIAELSRRRLDEVDLPGFSDEYRGGRWKPLPSLYVSVEADAYTNLAPHLLAQEYNEGAGPIRVWDDPRPLTSAVMYELFSDCLNTGCKFMVVDPMDHYILTNKNSTQHMRFVFSYLDTFARAAGVTIIGIRHENKSRTGNRMLDASGSVSAGAGVVRSALSLDHFDQSDKAAPLRLSHVKSNDAPRGESLGIQLIGGGRDSSPKLEWLELPKGSETEGNEVAEEFKGRYKTLREAITTALERAPSQTLTTGELRMVPAVQEALGDLKGDSRDATFRGQLSALKREGVVSRLAVGVYKLTAGR
jgi:hypothetical protein